MRPSLSYSYAEMTTTAGQPPRETCWGSAASVGVATARSASRYRHRQQVRVASANDLPVLEHGDGPPQVEAGPQMLRVVVQAVAMGPRLRAHPEFELVGGYVS